jgi:hypothetical protein
MPLTDLPELLKAIQYEQVINYKTGNQGAYIGYKARSFVQGFRQTLREDCGQTYAPTMQDGTIRALLQNAALKNLSRC